MRDAWSSHESWVYECLCCFTTWNEEFEVQHIGGGHHEEGIVYEHDGHRCMNPWSDHPCPGCESNNVKAYSAPWTVHVDAPHAQRADDLELVFRLRRLHAW
ncbi:MULTISPECIES: hypothetical protein [Thermomonosporaceae]|uniref:hypothetical protein n=1 Tax=Thermomonosporaceae TaxID=2012 RepID=UPI00255ACB23|nr:MULTISPECIES: hypothetical protein [Thermomonosporaceae]MDL4772381.1 hypothetical protein [Actinomadura xylanilytica]